MTGPLVCFAPGQGPRRRPTRGLAALTIVMVLFFVMALVSAYANRNLLFEQRIANNGYRSERSASAADAGLDWAITMLNSGRIDNRCQPSRNTAMPTFRERYLARLADGQYGIVSPPAPVVRLHSSCVLSGRALTCVCPTEAAPDPVPHAVRDWNPATPGSAFRVAALKSASLAPGTVPLEVLGCGSPGSGATSCADINTPVVDGQTMVRATVGLVRALPNVPPAALTTGGSVSANGDLVVSNPDGPTGMTVHSGGAFSAAALSQLVGPAGSQDPGLMSGDASLAALRPANAANRFGPLDTFFRATFGMPPADYRMQPATVRITCPGGTCGTPELESAVQRYPGLMLWFDGNLVLTFPPAAPLGTRAWPLMVVVRGRLEMRAPADLTGFFYASDLLWSAGGSGSVIRGALMAVGDFESDAGTTTTLVYDGEALRNIQNYYGSFVRLPAGWDRPPIN